MKREISFIIVFIFCLLFSFFGGCYVGRSSVKNNISETEILVSADTVYVSGSVEIDTVVVSAPEQKIRFRHNDKMIDIAGIITLPSKKLELSYFIKPIEIQITGDSGINTNGYNVTLTHSPVSPSGLPRERFAIYSGVAYHKDSRRIEPCIMAGVKFNRITFYTGITGVETITAGVAYGF